MPTLIASEPEKFYVEDMQGNASLSETLMNKIGSSHNFILDNFYSYEFGINGNIDGLSVYPYTFSLEREVILTDSEINHISIRLDTSGTSGNTEFRLEKQLAAGGTWTNIFSTNCTISNTSIDDLTFKNTDTAPSGVIQPVITTNNFLAGDRLRFVLVGAATGAKNILIRVVMRPV